MIATGCALSSLKNFFKIGTYLKLLSALVTFIFVKACPAFAGPGLWGLVNNAGIMFSSPIEWTPVGTFKLLADVNLWGMVDVTKAFLPLLKNAKGRVVNMSSTAGKYLTKKATQ